MAKLTLGEEQVEEEPTVDDGKVKIAKLWKPFHIKHGGWWVILELQAAQPQGKSALKHEHLHQKLGSHVSTAGAQKNWEGFSLEPMQPPPQCKAGTFREWWGGQEIRSKSTQNVLAFAYKEWRRNVPKISSHTPQIFNDQRLRVGHADWGATWGDQGFWSPNSGGGLTELWEIPQRHSSIVDTRTWRHRSRTERNSETFRVTPECREVQTTGLQSSLEGTGIKGKHWRTKRGPWGPRNLPARLGSRRRSLWGLSSEAQADCRIPPVLSPCPAHRTVSIHLSKYLRSVVNWIKLHV